MYEYTDIIVEIKERVATITINRPKTLNSLRMHTKHELEDALDKMAVDDNVGGIIITGTGRGFIAGSEITEISTGRPGSETCEMAENALRMIGKIEKMPKVVLAAINGYALGGGLELTLACDLRYASKTAKMGVPEIDLGVAPCYGGTQRLPRLIGVGKAKELLFTAKKLDAQEALEIGLINKVCEPDELMDDAFNMVKSIVNKAPIAIAQIKRCVNDGMEMSLEDGLKLETEVAGLLVETEDATEGVNAFLEKREPVFKNK